VIEGSARTVAVNAAFGHEVNETLARLLAALVGQRAGSSIGMDVDPYRIEFEVPHGVGPGTFREVLETTDPDRLEAYLELALKTRRAQVHARAGRREVRFDQALPRGGGRFGGDRLLAALEGTPVYDEALREVIPRRPSVGETAELLEDVQDGSIDLAIARERTPLGIAGRSSGTEFLVPENADADVIETIRERIRNDRVILFCLHCADWKRTTKVRRVPDQPKCPDCGSTRVATLNPWDEETVTAVRATEKDEEQERRTKRPPPPQASSRPTGSAR